MKNLFLKLISIFLILLFCFSPLGAIDLDQGDNSTHVSDNNGTDFKDINDTIDVDDVDIEVKSVNETDDLKELGNDVKSKRASINETNSSKNLKLKELKL